MVQKTKYTQEIYLEEIRINGIWLALLTFGCATLAEYSSGPDALYKINYTLKYKVTNPKEFYKFINNINNSLPIKLNDELRL